MVLQNTVIVSDGLTPFIGEWYGLFLLQVIKHQYRHAPALHFLRINVKDFLFQTETLVAEVYCTGADGNPVSTFYLGKKLHLYLHHENSVLIPVKAFAHSRDIVSLTRVVELKIYGIVHVSELVNVVETYLKRHHMVKLVFSFFCHLFKSQLLKSAAKLQKKRQNIQILPFLFFEKRYLSVSADDRH
jgi:hypothetical protein